VNRPWDLDGNLAFKPGVGGAIHLPHPAFPYLCGEVVHAEALAR
jgi:hypothetical protein